MNKITSKLSLFAFASILIFTSCKPEKKETVITENFKGVFVINEGGFLKSNGSVGLYKPGTGEYFDAFLKANNRPLGDVVQSMTLINEKYYIVVNNSNKIEVVNQSDFKSVTAISVSQPRNIIKVSDTKAYISQLNGTAMSVLDLTTNTITKTIQVKAPTDGMALMNKTVYAGEAYGDMVYLINTTDDQVTDSVLVGSGLSSIVTLSAAQIAVQCIGSIDFSSGNILEKGKIAIINSDSAKIERQIDLGTAGYSGSMALHAGSFYYQLGDGNLYTLSSSATSAPASASVTIGGSIYGFGIDPDNGDIYLTDAGNFDAAGKVYVYSSAFSLKKTIASGIVPSKVVFNY